MARPHTAQGLLGSEALLPLKSGFAGFAGFALRAVIGARPLPESTADLDPVQVEFEPVECAGHTAILGATDARVPSDPGMARAPPRAWRLHQTSGSLA